MIPELNYYSISNSNIQKSEELYQKGNQSIKSGYQLQFRIQIQLYWNDKFEETIKLF
ncbi:unnamed protein product [Paramecium octaurelia]|uniref:Uncharacterized protein n=1 Tax=Paramecium octaurelia TaxID=43137 RepID=A0A8S1YMS4_PAROT|nr:unnamed protein product [Paramecium octaurelia]